MQFNSHFTKNFFVIRRFYHQVKINYTDRQNFIFYHLIFSDSWCVWQTWWKNEQEGSIIDIGMYVVLLYSSVALLREYVAPGNKLHALSILLAQRHLLPNISRENQKGIKSGTHMQCSIKYYWLFVYNHKFVVQIKIVIWIKTTCWKDVLLCHYIVLLLFVMYSSLIPYPIVLTKEDHSIALYFIMIQNRSHIELCLWLCSFMPPRRLYYMDLAQTFFFCISEQVLVSHLNLSTYFISKLSVLSLMHENDILVINCWAKRNISKTRLFPSDISSSTWTNVHANVVVLHTSKSFFKLTIFAFVTMHRMNRFT